MPTADWTPDRLQRLALALQPHRTMPNPTDLFQRLHNRPGGVALWRLAMQLRFRTRDAQADLLALLARIPGPIGLWALGAELRLMQQLNADHRALLYLAREL